MRAKVAGEAFERLRHVGASVAEPEVISRIPELRCRQEQDSFALHQRRGEVVDALAGEFGKTNAPRARTNPGQPVRVLAEECIKRGQILLDDAARAGQYA